MFPLKPHSEEQLRALKALAVDVHGAAPARDTGPTAERA